MLDLKGKKALVTGGGSGIGRAVSLLLAQYGADVAVHYRNSEAGADEVVDRIRSNGGSATKFRCDLTNEPEVAGLFREIRREMGAPPDILVNNAGNLLERRGNGEMTEELYGRIMDVNLKSVVLACKYAIPGMKEAGGGRIVNMTSLAAHNGGGPGRRCMRPEKPRLAPTPRDSPKSLRGPAFW